jgi:hypothetical protein
MRLVKLDFYTKRINKEGNMKYKVGDKARVRNDLVHGEKYGSNTFISDMAKYKGAEVTIATINTSKYLYGYEIEEDGRNWIWTDEMLEDVSENNVGEIKARRTVDVGYYLKFCGHRVIENVYQGVDNGKLFFTTVDGLNQYTLPKDAIEWVVPHEG